MAVQCVLVGKGKDDVFTAVYGETTFDKVLKAYNENKVVQVIYQNRIYYLDNTTVVDSPEAFSFISAFSNQNDETGEIKHYVISLMTGDSWSGPFLQNSTPAIHARTHAKNSTDPLAPADIGAMELSENILKQSNEDITSQVAQALSKNLVPFSGGTMTGLLNVLTPVGDSNATTKKYVDDALSEKIGMDGIGDLHVWRKTVVTSDPIPEVPASYNIGSAMSLLFATPTDTSNAGYVQNLNVSESISVDQHGTVSLVSPSTVNFVIGYNSSTFDVNDSAVLGSNKRYFMVGSNTWGNRATVNNELLNVVYYVAPNTTFTQGNKDNKTPGYFNAAQKVTGIPFTPAIPAGTTVTYPVSTNPNAYQEGNDAKPAGYTLGEVVSGSFYMGIPRNSYQNTYTYSSSLSVSDDGTISLANPSTAISSQWSPLSTDAINSTLVGKFVQWTCQDPNNLDTKYPFNASPSPIIFIPSDAKITVTTPDSNERFTLSKYQPVTGYAAIPVGTTIEYLGKLGDKARVQVVSYVGTGTYGSSNPNSLTFDFAPKVVRLLGGISSGGNFTVCVIYPTNTNYGIHSAILFTKALTTTYKARLGFSENNYTASYCKISQDGKTVTWYNNGDDQINTAGYTYYFLALG